MGTLKMKSLKERISQILLIPRIKTISFQCIIYLPMTKQLLAQYNINPHYTPVVVYHMLCSVTCHGHIISLNLHSEPPCKDDHYFHCASKRHKVSLRKLLKISELERRLELLIFYSNLVLLTSVLY